MKIFLFVSLFFLSTAFAKTKTLPPVDEVISAMELTPEMIQGLIDGLYPNVAIELKEGAAIPLHFFYKTKIVSLECNPNLTTRITATSYLRAVKRKLYMSEDLIHWTNPKNFFGGSLRNSIKMSADKSHAIIETELRDYAEQQ